MLGCSQAGETTTASPELKSETSATPVETIEPTPTPSNTELLIGTWRLEGIGIYEFREDNMMGVTFDTGSYDEYPYTATEEEITFDRADEGITVNTYTVTSDTLTLTDDAGVTYTLSRQA